MLMLLFYPAPVHPLDSYPILDTWIVSALIIKFITRIFYWFGRWKEFKQQMKDMLRHSDIKGTEVKKAGGSVYTFPMPDCMCKQAVLKSENANTT